MPSRATTFPTRAASPRATRSPTPPPSNSSSAANRDDPPLPRLHQLGVGCCYALRRKFRRGEEMSSDRIHLNVDEARALGERALRGIGYDDEEARIVTDHVIDAALCGYEYSGLAKLLNIPEHRRFAQPRGPIRLLHETEVSALYDGGNNVGMLAVYHAARATIAKAERHGIAIVGMTNTWMSGRNAYFVEMIANAGLV